MSGIKVPGGPGTTALLGAGGRREIENSESVVKTDGRAAG